MWFIEWLFGEWECVVAEPVDPKGRSLWFLVCHQHSITKRCKGYVDMGMGKPLYTLTQEVATEHVKEKGKK